MNLKELVMYYFAGIVLLYLLYKGSWIILAPIALIYISVLYFRHHNKLRGNLDISDFDQREALEQNQKKEHDKLQNQKENLV